MNHLKLAPLVGLLFLLPACNRDGQEPVSSSAEEENETPSNRIDIPPIVRSNLGLTFAKVERRNVANTVRVPGSFELQPLAKHEYRMMLSGHIEFLVNQFDEVKSGTPLYRFRSLLLLDLQQRVDLATASLRQSEAKYETARARKRALAKADFKRAELDTQVAELEAETDQREAELAAASAALANASQSSSEEKPAARVDRGDWVEVRAKEPGVIESLAVTNGTFVEETTLILTTVDPTKVRFRAIALQSDLPKFRNGQQVKIVPPQGAGNDLNESIEAELKIGLSADPRQRTMTLYAMPGELKSWVRPGVSAFLEIAEESSDGVVLAIPRSSVVKDGLTHVFFKRDPLDANKAIRVEADLGVDDGRWIGIKSELGPNDEVVLNGVYELRLASSQSGTSQKGGHFHADGSYHGKDDE
ncbi:MAG: multidrug efflux pump subunit AcrA (membrane-fusion protein) [Akkermansiaceae bacterium]|jgi:multidrug efflux pump subunit AcrA (membrane-fusion protein)